MKQLELMGIILSDKGIGPTAEKVKAVVNAREPETASEVRSFLGLVNFSARFIPDLSTTAEPMRRLTRKGATFKWEREQQQAFDKLKNALLNSETLAYFNKMIVTQILLSFESVFCLATEASALHHSKFCVMS